MSALGPAVVLVAAACPGESTTITIPEDTGTIVGRVIDSRGAPVAGATIFITPFVPNRTTDSAGRFEIVDLTLGTDYLLTATKPGYISSSVQVRATSSQPTVAVEFTIARLTAAHAPP